MMVFNKMLTMGALLLLSGCTSIQPWVKPFERSFLADELMSFDKDPLAARHLNQAYGINEAARGAELQDDQAITVRLPADRADILYESINDTDTQRSGPSLFARKTFKDKVSVFAGYRTHNTTDQSISVAGAPEADYQQDTKHYTLGGQYLYGKASIALSGKQSTQSDYDAQTINIDLSQEFFGDMTTVSLGYSRGDDTIKQLGNTDFDAQLNRQHFRMSLTQILTPKWIIALSGESIADQGYLNSPYRQVNFLNADGTVGQQQERYPNTRNSDAFALRTLYRLPNRASIRAEYRIFSDNWGIAANNAELRYLQRYREQWMFQASVRTYEQSQASFYADLFPFEDAQTFLARDKTLSDFNALSFGAGVSYELHKKWAPYIHRTTVNLNIEHIASDYNNFRDDTGRISGASGFAPGDEPLYTTKNTVIRFFVSVYY